MRVLWLIRDDLTRQPGGDTMQILETAEGLRRLGVTVNMAAGRRPSMAGYDLVHLWHLDRLWENEPHCRRIRAEHRPAVLSTIYWPADEYDRGGRIGFQGMLARTFGSEAYRSLRVLQRWGMSMGRRHISRPTWSFRRSARFCVETMRVLLPNSTAEQHVIERALGVTRPTIVVPNAVSNAYLDNAIGLEERAGVLCAGRIEPRKNQLSLIRAVANSDVPLTLVGQPGRYNRRYADQCRFEAGGNVRFVGHAGPDELRGWYRRSLVHVCPSWYETPGLVNLEAAVCGCAIVATEGGCTREYLGTDAVYCRPNDPQSIRDAIRRAIAAGPQPQLAERIRRDYTWSAAARKTYEAYQLALA